MASNFFVQPRPSLKTKQGNFDEALLEYVTFTLKPYSTVEDPYFMKMITILDPSVKIMTRKTLMRRIAKMAEDDHENSTAVLAKGKYIATGADIWSCAKHGYLGVTATTILPSFERVNRAIACKHFKNPHNGPRIAELIGEVHDEHGLATPKLRGTVTDNEGNIVNAFNIASVDTELVELKDELLDLVNTLPSHQR